MACNSVIILLLQLWLPFLIHATSSFQHRCLSFAPEAYIHNSSRHALDYLAAGTTLALPDNDPTCNRSSQLVTVNICRVGLSIPTSNRSSISFELWLPEDWSDRVLVTGNGGIDGCKSFAWCITHLIVWVHKLTSFTQVLSTRTLRTVRSTDLPLSARTMGIMAPLLLQCITIQTSSLILLGDRALPSFVVLQTSFHSPWTVADLIYPVRLHTITVAGKKLINLFYDKGYRKSYFLGCSLGGRQGIKAAEMFPSDFDGIVAGSPALDFNNLQSWRARFFTITGRANSSNFISKGLWTGLIHDEVLIQCDGLDGVMDGIIEDPNRCNFRPEGLICTKNKTTSCLTSSQAAMVREIFSPFYGEDGKLIYPGMQPGSEILAATNLYAGKPFSYSEVTTPPRQV